MTAAETRLWARSLAILAAVTLVAAWFSDLFYFPDEHYQVLEFMGYKLGLTPVAALPWEFAARIRPWTQPFLYWLIAAPLRAAGISDMFTITFILRALTGLFSVAALAAFARAVTRTLAGEEVRRAFLRYLPFYGYLPFLFVRTSSETLSAAFFTLGLALVIANRSTARLFLAGLLCGLAFDCRYQTGLMSAGLFFWLAIIARETPRRLALLVLGGLLAVALGALADHWGYGAWVFPPWDYLQVNVVQGVAASQYGREPVFAYLYLMPAQLFFAITLAVMAGMVVMWLRNPRHPVSWVTIPFVLGHMALAHKEARFLFPLALLSTSFLVLGFMPDLPRGRAFAARFWAWRKGWVAKAVTGLSILGMAFLAVYPLGVRPHMPMAKYLYRHFSGTAYAVGAPFPDYPIYRRADVILAKPSAPLATMLARGPVTVLTDKPAPPPLPPGIRAELVYSEFPFARSHPEWGLGFLQGYRDLDRKARFLKLIPLYWFTLYRLERSSTIRS